MGLRETFQKAAKTAMTAADNVPERATFHYLAYDNQGQWTGGDQYTFSDIPALRNNYRVEKPEETDAMIRARQYLVTGIDLEGVIPREDDTLDVEGETWIINLVEPDPANATFMLHVRR